MRNKKYNFTKENFDSFKYIFNNKNRLQLGNRFEKGFFYYLVSVTVQNSQVGAEQLFTENVWDLGISYRKL